MFDKVSLSKTTKGVRRLWICFCTQICLLGYYNALGNSQAQKSFASQALHDPVGNMETKKADAFTPCNSL